MGEALTTQGLTAAEAVLDERTLDRLEECAGRDVAARLARLFCDAEAERARRLTEAVHARDLRAVRQIAHDWVPDAAAVGARDLCDLARALEARAIASDVQTYDAATSLLPLAAAAAAALRRRYGGES